MAKGGGKSQSEDWACCEKCSYCFTICVGILFFLAGGAMAVYAALYMWSDIDVGIDGIDLLNTDAIQYGIFIIGLAIACTALLGMVSAGCAKCAANPDGVNDCCERCCTAILSVIYIIILSVLLAATLVIAGGLSYYAVLLTDSTAQDCPYPQGMAFTATNVPDAVTCPIDFLLHETFYAGTDVEGVQVAWQAAQNASKLCGFYCDGAANPDYCSLSMPNATDLYGPQLTGLNCFVSATLPFPEWVVFQGNSGADASGAANSASLFDASAGPVTMPYRPTFYAVLNSFLIPLLAVWWCIFVFAILLIVAACVMCVRKKKMTKESKYRPDGGV